MLKQVKAGDKVDIRDTEFIWCVGTVELKISSEKREPLLYIHYEVNKLVFFKKIIIGMESQVRRVHLPKLKKSCTLGNIFLKKRHPQVLKTKT